MHRARAHRGKYGWEWEQSQGDQTRRGRRFASWRLSFGELYTRKVGIGMFSRTAVALMSLMLMASVSGIDTSAQDQQSFVISIGGSLCDVNPRDNPDAICAPADKVLITIALESGQPIGSCTLKFFYSPSGGVGAGCGVEGVPPNSTVVVAVDQNSLPTGYRALNSPQTFDVGAIQPGGGDAPIISFTI